MSIVFQVDLVEVNARIARLDAIEAEMDKVGDGSEEHLQRLYELSNARMIGVRTGWGPMIGMPCTYHIGTDAYAAVVVCASPSGHRVGIKVGKQAGTRFFTLRKSGCYVSLGQDIGRLQFLRAVDRLDPSF